MEFDQLLTLIETVSRSEITCFQYEENGTVVKLDKETVKMCMEDSGKKPFPVISEEQEGKITDSLSTEVTSPLVGVFYEAPAQDAEPFVKVGDRVEEGQTLAIIEAMKLMNEIEAETSGIITDVLVENGQMVEYGQPLFRIRACS